MGGREQEKTGTQKKSDQCVCVCVCVCVPPLSAGGMRVGVRRSALGDVSGALENGRRCL